MRWVKKRVWIFFIFSMFSQIPANALDTDSSACDGTEIINPLATLNISFTDLENIIHGSISVPKDMHIFDISFSASAKGTITSAIPVTMAELSYPAWQAVHSHSLHGGTSAKNFGEYMDELAKDKNNLSFEQKLVILQNAGNALSDCFDQTDGTGMTSMEQIFSSVTVAGTKCGVCRDIHTFLARMASALGFSEAGTNSLDWQKNNNGGGGHAIAYFKNPQTGHFYLINYNEFFDTKQSTVQGANDVATHLLAPLSSISYIETLPGHVHVRQPNTSTWIRDTIEKQSRFDFGNTLITAQMGVDGSFAFGAQVPVEAKLQANKNDFALNMIAKTKLFAGANNYIGNDGVYKLQFAGVAGSYEEKIQSNDFKKELKLLADGYFGSSIFVSPIPNGEQNYNFDAFNLLGTASLDPVSLKIEFRTNNMGRRFSSDINDYVSAGNYTELSAGVDYQAFDWLQVGSERVFQYLTKNDYSSFALSTAWDKVHLIVDTRGKSKAGEQVKEAYLIYDGKIYILDGINKSSAFALSNQIKAALPGAGGIDREVSVLFDLDFMLSNPSQDPYYNIPLAIALGVNWKEKILNNKAIMESSVSAGVGSRPFYITQYDPSNLYPVLPDIPAYSDIKGHLSGSLDFKF